MKVNYKTLQKKMPFRHYHVDALIELSRSAVLIAYKRGDEIFSSGDNDEKSAFLVTGRVRLVAADQRTEKLLITGSRESAYPLSRIKPRQYTGIADTHDTCIVWVHDKISRHIEQKYQLTFPDEREIYAKIITEWPSSVAG